MAEANSSTAIRKNIEEYDEDEFEGFGLFDSIEEDVPNPGTEENKPKPISLDNLLDEHYNNTIKKFDGKTISEKPFIIAIHGVREDCTHLKKWLDVFYQVVPKCQHRIDFFVADVYDGISLNIKLSKADLCGLHASPFTYALDSEKRIYDFTGFLTDERLTNFCEKLLNGDLLRSEAEPDQRDDEIVRIAVGTNLESLLNSNADKDTFINFYAHWCYFSKELLLNLEEVAKKLSSENIVIMKMDAELNYAPHRFQVNCYPKSYLIPKNNKDDFVLYNGGPRTIENLLKFIAKNSSEELINYDREGNLKFNVSV